jgi:hypothetical protein
MRGRSGGDLAMDLWKMSTRARRRQKLGGATYDTFSVQYQKNNFYLAGARKPRWSG